MRKAAGLILTLILSGAASAEPVPKSHQRGVDAISASIAPGRAQRGETVTLRVHVHLRDRARIYATQEPGSNWEGLETVRFDVASTPTVIPVGSVQEPLSRKLYIDAGLDPVRIVEGRATWERSLVVSPEAKPGEHKVAVIFRGQITTDRM